MKKLMDIISNWNKGKRAHDDRVAQLIAIDLTPERIKHAKRILGYIEGCMVDMWPMPLSVRDLEAKQWQILAEYAQDQVKALTVIKSDIVPTEATNDNSAFNPLKDRISTTIDGSTLNTVIQRAEKRHGYGIQP